jgi:hypothetical protein
MLARLGGLVVVVASAMACGGTPDNQQPGFCCEIEAQPSCGCIPTGGRTSPTGGCGATCDVDPSAWVPSVDDAGCPIWWLDYSRWKSCLPGPDAGTDSGPPDAASD